MFEIQMCDKPKVNNINCNILYLLARSKFVFCIWQGCFAYFLIQMFEITQEIC